MPALGLGGLLAGVEAAGAGFSCASEGAHSNAMVAITQRIRFTTTPQEMDETKKQTSLGVSAAGQKHCFQWIMAWIPGFPKRECAGEPSASMVMAHGRIRVMVVFRRKTWCSFAACLAISIATRAQAPIWRPLPHIEGETLGGV